MGSCTDLATKPEVAAKIDKAEKPEIIKASATAAVPTVVAIVATYADEAAAVAKEALALAKSGLALAKSALGQIAKFLGGLANILSLIGLLATQAQLLILNNDLRRLQSQLKQVQSIATGAAFRAEEAIRTSNAAVSQANTAIAKSNEAIAIANGVASKANQAITIANAANSEAIRARTEAIAASNQASDASRAASYATTKANEAIVKADGAITQSNQAKIEANTALKDANVASAKADEAIRQSNANAQELANLRAEVVQLKREARSKDIGLAVLRAAVAATKAEVANKESKYIVRTVKQATITNASGIRDLKGNLIGMESKIGKTVGELGTTLTKTFDQKIADSTKDIRAGIGGGGISLEGAKAGVFKDLFGNTKANSQLKEVIGTEVTAQTKALELVNTQQYTDLKTQVAGIPLVLGGIVSTGIAAQLKPFGGAINQTIVQTAPTALSQAAAAGVCSTTQPGGCMNNNILQPINKNFDRFLNAAGATAAAANNALLMRMQGVLNTVKSNTDVIKATTSATQGIVSHATYGLQAVQKFADTAWKATHADKILNGITTTLVIHNAVMLSGNLAQTVGEAASGSLSAMGIKDSGGNPINVNAVVKGKMTNLIKSMIGTENYAALTKKLAAANRIYQSAANVLDLTRSLFDSARNVAELTAENTGKIGNALRESGAVYEDAYQLMQEKVNPQNQAMRRLEGLSNTLQTLEQGASAISEVSSEIVETKENIAELRKEKKDLADETKLFLDAEKVKKEDVKAESQAETEIAKLDFAKDETDD